VFHKTFVWRISPLPKASYGKCGVCGTSSLRAVPDSKGSKLESGTARRLRNFLSRSFFLQAKQNAASLRTLYSSHSKRLYQLALYLSEISGASAEMICPILD
jgi:hypothetical protein